MTKTSAKTWIISAMCEPCGGHTDHTFAENDDGFPEDEGACAYADEHPRDHYDAFRRAHGLWADADGNFFAGVFADSPHAVTMTPASFVGWISGTEYTDDTDWWKTVPLSDVESIVFMERDGFVLYGEPDGEAAYVAAMGKPSTRKQAPTTGKEL